MIFLFLMLSAWQHAGPGAPCHARLELQQQGSMLTVTGHCRNFQPATAHYRYELAMLRESAGGRSQNTQRGEVAVDSQQEVSLSRTQVNAGPQDTYRIHLRVLDMEGHILAQDSAIQNPAR
ncbi:curli-like amyloid fiber formation chaperone CsgH [Hymenobacter ruricola]|uniref:Curli assembly protein CsgC n=1 Tax=Hymenobacter ruricola TaxID=2791023 RepID=A0ABS0I8M6_9BACT|nr:curli-like amyloid fiber formation chaperone CsgH [Hymenobacter ruricola]MBF9223267.1 hypothetical protein [Hymenobacter ruricola]